ncbi:MAG TPA: PIN domain-containing protein [Polyangia bacterium]
MILVDTTVWIDFLAGRDGAAPLRELLLADQVVCHPAIRGEIALGSLAKRSEILGLLTRLPSTAVATNDEVLALVEAKHLYASGIGWVDAHLLAGALVSACPLWTHDKKLRAVADRLGMSATI